MATVRAVWTDVAGETGCVVGAGESGRGCGRNSDAELARSARTSLGSASELSYWIILAHDLDYIARTERDDFQDSVSEVRRMLTSLERVSSLAADRRRRR